MSTNLAVFNYVLNRAKETSRRLTIAEMLTQDQQDAVIGQASFDELSPKVKAIVRQLRAFSNCQFQVYFKIHPERGVAQVGGDIILDYSMLNKPVIEIAQILAHEWGHLALGHVINPYWLKAVKLDEKIAEQEADFYSGVFLGAMGYDLDEIVNIKLALPDGDEQNHGERLNRAYFLACGFHHGVERKETGLEGTPGVHVFGRSALSTSMPEGIASKLRN